MPKRMLKCYYCNESFDANVEPHVRVNTTRFAHKHCAEEVAAGKNKEIADKEQLESYIKSLFGISYITPKIQKQIREFHEIHRYGYSAMYKTLRYFFEVRKNDIEKSNGGIGIIPWAIDEARKYYTAIEKAQATNEGKKIEEFVLPVKEVKIPPPQKQIMRQTAKLFSFLDEGSDIA